MQWSFSWSSFLAKASFSQSLGSALASHCYVRQYDCPLQGPFYAELSTAKRGQSPATKQQSMSSTLRWTFLYSGAARDIWAPLAG